MEGNNIHCVTKISEKCTGLAQLDGFVQTMTSSSHELLLIVVHTSNRVCLVHIAVEACSVG